MLKRGRPALTVPDVAPMDVVDVFMTFRQKGVSIQKASAAAMYALVANQVGWDALGLSRTNVYEYRKMFIDFGINPDRIETVPLSEQHKNDLVQAMKLGAEKQSRKEYRQVVGLPEPDEIQAKPGPLRFVEPGPLPAKK